MNRLQGTALSAPGKLPRSLALVLQLLTLSVVTPGAVWAQPRPADDQKATIEQLQMQIIEVQRESQRKLEAIQRETEQQLNRLQAQLAQMSIPPNATSKPPALDSGRLDRLDWSGDFRLRYENNSSYAGLPSWDRGVLRGRLAAHYSLTERLEIGTRIVTGDPDNPRTADVTIGDFASDLDVSLDQAYVSFEDNSLFVTGGKFAKPFTSTELVWDGDVNPQGLGGHYDLNPGEAWSARLSGIYFAMDPGIFEDGSDMAGGQISITLVSGPEWNLALHAAYFDYDIGALDPDAPGGARGNNVTPDGAHYVSDFNLLDFVGSATYTGFGDPWDVRFIGDYVRNLGAAVPEDSGYGFDLLVGNLRQAGRFLFRYGYSQVETDAVLGMYSNDNILYPTNYVMHSFSVDYALKEHTFVGITNYLYRRLEKSSGPEAFPNDWQSRTRLNLYFTF